MPPTNSTTQAGIDKVNAALSQDNRNDPFAQVKNILDGEATVRAQRKGTNNDICDSYLPGNTVADSNHPALVVALSPNSSDGGLEEASAPVVNSAVNSVAYINLFQPNPSRRRMTIQNNGSTGIYIVFGRAQTFLQTPTQQASPFTVYHIKLTPNAIYIDDAWRGRVDIVSDGAGGVVSATEFWRAQNPS